MSSRFEGFRGDAAFPAEYLVFLDSGVVRSNSPFGIVGLAGNVAESVTAEPGSWRVLGTMGSSFKHPCTNDVDVVWPAGTR